MGKIVKILKYTYIFEKCKNLNNLYFNPFLSIYISIKKLHMVKERSSHHASQLNPSNIRYTYGFLGLESLPPFTR